MTVIVVRVKCVVRGVEIVKTGGRCRAIVLFFNCLLSFSPTPEELDQYVPVYHTTKLYDHSFRIRSPMKMEQTQ
jgi:hypothetical protein